MRRIFFFMLTNIAVLVTISLVMNILGLGHYIDQQGINYESLMVFCLLWGMGGAFISLLLSKKMAKWMMRLQIVDPNTSNPSERWIYDTVERLAREANLPKTPEVAIYQAPEVNAFATGPSKSNSLVAVSTGLLSQMNRQEVEGVIGHEIAHIANGDMVTMTLIQGVVNAFVMFFARIAAFAVSQFLRGDEEEGAPSGMVYFLLTFLFDILFGILGSMVVAWFSRMREYRADRGGAQLTGTGSMVSALQRLRAYTDHVDTSHASMASMKISGAKGFMALLSTHPPLEDRIRRLQEHG